MRTLKIITKIIAFYCLLYAVIKIFGVIKGMWFFPNLIIVAGLLILGGIGYLVIKKNSYNWWYAIIGVVLISALRYYEIDLVAYLNELFST